MGLVLRNLKDANMTQYDQCSANGATVRIDYQRGEALDVIMLTTEKEKENTRFRAEKRWTMVGIKIDERWEHPEEYGCLLIFHRHCLLAPLLRRSCELFSIEFISRPTPARRRHLILERNCL